MAYQYNDLEIPPSIEWVYVNENYHHISEYADLAPSRRPKECFCPVCKEEVTLKLGEINRHHIAHQPGTICPASRVETAIHFNSKMALWSALRKGISLEITSHCAGCARYQSVQWLDFWDKVEFEYTVGGFRPDIAFIEDGRVIAAIEIYVNSKVNERKSQFYAENNIKWIEVEGTPELYERNMTGNIQLDYTSGKTDLPKWVCNLCKIKIANGEKTDRQLAEERQKKVARIIEHKEKKANRKKWYDTNNGRFIRAVTVFDIYSESPLLNRRRYLTYLYIQRIYGATTKTWVAAENEETAIQIISVNNFVKDITNLRTSLTHYIDRHSQLYDAPLGWLTFPDEPKKLNKYFIDLLYHLPPHYEIGGNGEWVKYSNTSWEDIVDKYRNTH